MPADLVLNADNGGYGDFICCAWVAEGLKGTDSRLRFCTTVAAKRELLELLGQTVTGDPGAAFHVLPGSEFQTVHIEHGFVPRVISTARFLHLPHVWKRPPRPRIRPAQAAAAESWWGARPPGRLRIACLGQATTVDRHWPHWSKFIALSDGAARKVETRTWTELAALLLAADVAVGEDSGPAHFAATLGLRTVVLCGPTCSGLYWHARENVTMLDCGRERMPCVRCHWQRAPIGDYCPACTLGCQALAALTPRAVLDACHAA